MGNDVERPDVGSFEPGDHLRVRRAGGYDHHGTYVNDHRVIQFGGGDISDKRSATIEAVSLQEFEREGYAERVEHGVGGLLRLWLPNADPPEKTIARAEWLLANHPAGRYDLVGNNCEHMANWCSTGWYTESLQVRRMLGVVTVVGAAGALSVLRWKRNSPQFVSWLVGVSAVQAVGVAAAAWYNWHIWRFQRDLGQQWRAYERPIAQGDPPARRQPSEGTED